VAHRSPGQLDRWLRTGEAFVIDVETSRRFRAGHVPGAAWAQRADLPAVAEQILRPEDPAGRVAQGPAGPPARVVLASADGALAAFAAGDLPGPVRARTAVLDGGTAGWADSGRPLQAGPGAMLSRADDVYRRPYEGTDVDPAAMQAYLDWEYGLVAQLERDGTHGFTVLTHSPRPGRVGGRRPGTAGSHRLYRPF
jgi:rhodanese-related sulfurtransferase